MSSHQQRTGGGAGGAGDTPNQRKRRHPQADVQQPPPPQPAPHHAASASAAVAASPAGSSFGVGGPRTLHVVEFAEARAREIAALTHVLSASGGGAANQPGANSSAGGANPAHVSGGGRRVFQSLPRHMRRRAMSHNIKRLPGRLHGAAQREMDKIEKSAPKDGTEKKTSGPSRRTRRRPRNILAMHAHRMAMHQWLETHVWHAKRMYMDEAWGYRVATRPTDRSLRACYNANVHLATIFDASATQVLAIEGHTVADIAHLLTRFVHAAHLTQLQSPELTSGNREGELHLHHAGAAPYGFIAAVKYQWQGAASRTASLASQQLWLWLHPSVYALVQSLLESALPAAAAVSSASSSSPSPIGVSIVPLLGQLCRIEMRGHRCQAVLRMAIRAVEKKQAAIAAASANDTTMTDSAASSPPPSIASLLTAYVSPALFPAHAIYALQAQHPERLQPPPSQPFEFRDGAPREKMNGTIAPASAPRRNNTFSKATDQTMAMHLSKPHHDFLFGLDGNESPAAAASASATPAVSAATSAPLVSPLFDADFRRRHTRETAWGAKKQRYNRIAVKEVERKRKMHQRRANEAAAKAEADQDEATMSDTTSSSARRRTNPKHSGGLAATAKPRSKDDLDVGSATTPLPSSQPTAAPLTNQPYLLLIQQPGSSVQCTAATPKTHINSPAHSLGSGWDIVCSAGWCTLLWKALIYSGARAIGREDRARFLHEQGRFDSQEPLDAPDTHAGQAAALHRQRSRMWHSLRIPTNKKPNYHRNHVEHPFATPFFELLELDQQEQAEARYEPLIRKPTHSGDQSDDESEDEAGDAPTPSVNGKKQKTTEQKESADGDVAMEDAMAVKPASTTTVVARKSKKQKPRPDKLPPYELLAVPASFARTHLPFYVWRHWRTEYEQARLTEPTLTVPAFLTSSSAPPLDNVLLGVSVRCRSGGLPEDDSFLCATLPSEWRRFRTQQAAAPCDDPDASHNERNAKPQPWDVMSDRNNHVGVAAHPLRSSLGYVRHGWFSYQHGNGVALGFVAAGPFARLMQAQADDEAADSVWVWSRNQNSLTYRAAEVQLM